jgi:hypothetical protein
MGVKRVHAAINDPDHPLYGEQIRVSWVENGPTRKWLSVRVQINGRWFPLIDADQYLEWFGGVDAVR